MEGYIGCSENKNAFISDSQNGPGFQEEVTQTKSCLNGGGRERKVC